MIKKILKKHKNTTKNLLWRSLQTFSKQGVIFVMFIISSHLLVPKEFGLLNYLKDVIVLFILFCDFGISTATSKFVTEYSIKSKKKLSRIIPSVSALIFVTASIILFFVILFGKAFFGENYTYILFFLPYVYLVPLSSMMDGIYRGLKEFKKLSLVSLIIGFISLYASWILIKTYGLIGAIISQNLHHLLLIISLLALKKNLSYRIDRTTLEPIVRYSIIIGFTGIVGFLYSRVDSLILKYYGYITEIGYYAIVNQLITMLIIPAIIFGQVLAPDITTLFVNKKYAKLKSIFRKHLVGTLILGTILSLAMLMLFPMIIDIVFSKYFTVETILILKLILLILPLRLTSIVVGQAHLIPTGNVKLSLYTMIPSGIANVILDFYFISRFGFIGVVYATLICFSFAAISTILLYNYKINSYIK